MAKCDVCGKISLMPEKFGKTLVCKVCFMKINGPLWKYHQYDKQDNVKKQRDYVLPLQVVIQNLT